MREYNYNVVLDTELGKRNGTMQLSIDGTKIDGFLSLLNSTEPCCGNIGTDGRCSLHGKIVTLIKEMVYEATGYIREGEVVLKLQSGKNTFLMKGIASGKLGE
ncbi:MAG: hypothetical protein ACI3XF_08590 [Eubacteriales bacterium]